MPGAPKAAQDSARNRRPALRVHHAQFGRERRLLLSRQFSRVLAASERSSDRFFTVLSRPNDQPHPRLGLTVSRRVSRRAVDRNRIKRVARESFRQLSLGSLDFVVMARPPAGQARPVDLRRSLDHHFAALAARKPRATVTARNANG